MFNVSSASHRDLSYVANRDVKASTILMGREMSLEESQALFRHNQSCGWPVFQTSITASWDRANKQHQLSGKSTCLSSSLDLD